MTSRFLLVHGSAHGAWCWRDLLPALAAFGHRAQAIDLPGHGGDATPPQEVTLDSYAETIAAACRTAGVPVVLVGHSMAGYPITAAAERAPDRIAKLVYLCAYTPWPGHSLAQMRMAAPRQPLLEAVEPAADGLSFSIRDDMAREVFYHDCPEETVDYARARLCAQPVAPQSVPITLTERSQSLPRHYIRCTRDRAIPPEFQETMSADWPAGRVHSIDSDHSPFFSQPRRLARILDHIAKAPE